MKQPREYHPGPMSRLPEGEAYWEALTDRLVRDAAGRLRGYRRAGTRWWHGLVRYSTPLTVGAAAAVITALLWLPEAAPESPADLAPATVYGLAPKDSLTALFVRSAQVPTMATVLATPTLERAP